MAGPLLQQFQQQQQQQQQQAAAPQAPGPGADGLYFGKYKTWEEATKGIEELNQLLATQGGEVGTLRTQNKQYNDQLQQYMQWYQQNAAVVDWYLKNQSTLQQLQPYFQDPTLLQQQQKQLQQQQLQQQQQTTQVQPGQNALSILTDQEVAALQERFLAEARSQFLQPTIDQINQNLLTEADKREKALVERFTQQNKAFSDVMWKTMERIAPEDKLKEAREWHKKALTYSDPSKLDPMQLAGDVLEKDGSIASLKKENEDLTQKLKEATTPIPSTFGSESGGFLPTSKEGQPSVGSSANDRFAAVMETTAKEVGADGLGALFSKR